MKNQDKIFAIWIVIAVVIGTVVLFFGPQIHVGKAPVGLITGIVVACAGFFHSYFLIKQAD